MMEEVSRICDKYGLDVWIWYPAMDRDYSNPATVEFALKEWEQVYKRLPRIDYMFVPGGDPGHTQPKYLFALLEKQTALLHKYHPKAQMWMSPQSFSKEWIEEFYTLMKAEPAWLGGIVYGPQTRDDIPTLAARIPKRYPIRHYPDITHSTQSQFAVPDWDVAYAVTEGREGPNPRPTQERDIFRRYMDVGVGFLTYSEGVNDDVNKFIWSGLGWNPDQPVLDILREFSRYFIGETYRDTFAQGLLALERNWVGPLIANEGVDTTFQVFRDMEQHASPQVKLNWRFQQALYRAYYDSYVRDRLLYETSLEKQAMEKLRDADRTGSLLAVQMADETLNRALTESDLAGQAAAHLRTRRGPLPEHSRPVKRAEIPGARPRPRRRSRRRGRARHQPRVAQRPLRRDPQARRRKGAPARDLRDRELDQSRARRLLRRSRQSAAPAAPRVRRELCAGSDVPALPDDRLQHPRHGRCRRPGPELYALPALLGYGHGRPLRCARKAAL